ncbi:lysophospholipase L1-like esterase [Arcticibacter pallidicorallinus]|uniref:Lysophospholipase L1-like esterase n=1 Tax=Arcticibacter pallidicorallinus TaxID=1259464 RepID=A0A2T0U0K2_9SPHI|nr:GDSL-type esterase/lipase family protein [Arcticibacter pallidicorallinus]PRY51476.1 lysophospholipase L1-like esterase [Arcticibacter pallidicorallinus]
MKLKFVKAAVFSAALFAGGSAMAQEVKIDSSYNNVYYKGRMELFENLPLTGKSTVFLGNSITERGMWHELLPGKIVMNRGIGGDNTFGVLARIAPIISAKPVKVFLLIGINDIGRNLPVEVIASNYEKIIQQFRKGSPKTVIYLQSVLPMNDDILKADYLKNKGHLIVQLNDRVKALAAKYKLTYVNLHEVFDDGTGKLKASLTDDGIHIKPAAYVLWVDYLKRKAYL